MNIEEAYVSFETAKLLKEKGFDIAVRYYYQKIDDDITYHIEDFRNWNVYGIWYSMPTHQMAMRWLREVHNIKVNVFYSNFNCYAIEYFETNAQTGVDESVFIGDGYKSYEEAVEVALEYVLKNLI